MNFVRNRFSYEQFKLMYSFARLIRIAMVAPRKELTRTRRLEYARLASLVMDEIENAIGLQDNRPDRAPWKNGEPKSQ